MKMKKIIAITALFAMLLSFPLSAYADDSAYSPYMKASYNQQTKVQPYTVVHGLDLSYHNGDVDFKKLKDNGVKYVILRAGYRGYGKSGSIGLDKNFKAYYNAAIKQGLSVGAYFYSQALTVAEAKEEANKTIGVIKGLNITMPVYFDYEFAPDDDGRLNTAHLSLKQMTANTRAFCDTVKAAGFIPGIYASASFFYEHLDYEAMQKDYTIWVAHYTSYNAATKRYRATTYKGDYQMWQYSSKGKVSGTDSTYVDCNFMYEETMNAFLKKSPFTISAIKDQAYTGKEVRPSFTVTVNGKKLVKGDDYYVSYQNNVDIGTATVTVTGVNDYADDRSNSATFKIVPTKVNDLALSSRTANSITFKWDAHPDATRYRIQIKTATSFKTLADTKNTEYTIKDLDPAETVTLRVGPIKVIGGVDYVGKSCDWTAMTAAPAKVTGLKNAWNSPDAIKLTWTKQENVSYYNIYEYSADSDSYAYIHSTRNTYYKITKLPKHSEHKYKVRAVKTLTDGTKLYGTKSAALTAYTHPVAPKLNSATSNAAKKISVKWSKVSDASGYEVMWSTTKKFTSNYKSQFVTSPKTVSKTLSTARAKTTYYVRVRSYKLHGKKKVYSPWSATLSVKVK
ncbi:MAG: hypothetical protein E7520_06035 [Ruminococcaceae bacterium]|nr:hypothetical protein [Oscillospiraceae bacterium]